MKLSTFLLSMTMAAGWAYGQTSGGTLTGLVTDPSGSVIGSVPVVATHVDTGTKITGLTSQTGNYTIPQMPIGRYVVTVTAAGFKTFRQENVIIAAAQTLRLDVSMEVGATSESVTVTAESTLLQADTGAKASNILPQQIQDLPVFPIATITRDPIVLAYTLAGSVNQLGSQYGPRMNGMPVASNQYRIDGEIVMNSFTIDSSRNLISPDAVQEVAIQTSNFNAEYGSVSGSVFNQIVKSGTNQYHGTAYEYFVNDKLNADDAANHLRNRVRRNDYGFAVGGPVKIPKLYDGTDKTFFFFNWEQYGDYQFHETDFTPPTVPTQAYRNGDFSGLFTASGNANLRINGHDYRDPFGNAIALGTVFDPRSTQVVACNAALSQDCGGTGAMVTYRAPFVGNLVPKSLIDTVSSAILTKYVPLPQGPNAAAGTLTSNYLNPFHGYRVSRSPALKIDENITSAARLSFTYSDSHTESPVQALGGLGEGFPEPITANAGTFQGSPTFRLNFDDTLTPSMILHVGVGFQEFNYCACPQTLDYNAASDIGLTGATLAQTTFPRMGVTSAGAAGGLAVTSPQLGGMNTLGPSGAKTQQAERHPTSSASLTWVHGNHTFKFGGDFRKDYFVAFNTSNTPGTFSFGAATAGLQTGNGVTWQTSLDGLTGFQGNTNVGFPFANWLMGSVTSVTLGVPVDYRRTKTQTGIYIQDTWRVRRNLTIDYGLRWDYGTYLKEDFGRIADFSPTTPNPNASGRLGAYIYEANCNCNFAHNYPYAIGPRLGVAYTYDSKTVIRGGFGIAYGPTPVSVTGGAAISNIVTPTLQNGFDAFSLQNGIPSSYNPQFPNFDPGFGFTPDTVNALQSGVSLIDPNAGRPDRTYQWNISVQRELNRNLVVEASYVGNRNIWQSTNGFQDLNAVSVDTLQHYGFTVDGSAQGLSDATLLNTQFSRLSAAQRSTLAARGVGLPYSSFPTSGLFAQTVLQSLKPFPQFSSVIAPAAPMGKSWYDSLQLQLTKRFSHGLSGNVNYTYSKNLQFISSPDVFNQSVGKDLVGVNPPQVLRISFTYQTPFPKGTSLLGNRYVSQVVGGWAISGALYYQTAAYLDRPLSGSSNAISKWLGRGPGGAQLKKNADGSYMNPWSVDWTDLSGNHHTDPLDINCHCFDPNKTVVLNPDAWQTIPDATWTADTSTYSFFRGARRPSESANIARTFKFKERYQLQIRMEFTNVFNRTFLPNPLMGYSPVNAAATLQKDANGNYISGFGTFGNLSNAGALSGGNVGQGGQPRSGQLIARFSF